MRFGFCDSSSEMTATAIENSAMAAETMTVYSTTCAAQATSTSATTIPLTLQDVWLQPRVDDAGRGSTLRVLAQRATTMPNRRRKGSARPLTRTLLYHTKVREEYSFVQSRNFPGRVLPKGTWNKQREVEQRREGMEIEVHVEVT